MGRRTGFNPWRRLAATLADRIRLRISAVGRSRPMADRLGPGGGTFVVGPILPNFPPELLIEWTTMQVKQADVEAILPADRPDPPVRPFDPSAPGVTMPRRILLMLRELHRRGYEQLRAEVYFSGAGFWRCSIEPVSYAQRFREVPDQYLWARRAAYSDAAGARCFGWEDAVDDSPDQLAAKFLDRFAEMAEEGRGPDEAYARWYSEMLVATEPAGLIYEHADYVPPGDELYTLGAAEGIRIPLPPPPPPPPDADSGRRSP